MLYDTFNWVTTLLFVMFTYCTNKLPIKLKKPFSSLRVLKETDWVKKF